MRSGCGGSANVKLCRSRFRKCRWAAALYRKVRQGVAAHPLPRAAVGYQTTVSFRSKYHEMNSLICPELA